MGRPNLRSARRMNQIVPLVSPVLRAGALLLTGLLILSGCAGTAPTVLRPTPGTVPEGFPDHDAPTIRRSLGASTDSLRAISAVADVRLHTPEMDESYRVWIRQRREDSLLVTVSPGFGIEAVRGLATRDSVFLHDRFHHELYVGRFASARRLLPGLDSLGTVFANLTGTLRPTGDRDWSVRADSAFYYLERRTPDRREIFVVDPSLWRVVRYQLRTGGGRLVEERVFADYRRSGDYFLPGRIQVRRPLENQRLTVTYESTDPNPGDLELSFRVDPTVKRIPLERPR